MEMKPKRTRKSLSKQVMESIEKIILDQKLQPGDALPTEQQISEELGVSKSSVREAIKMLEALGVVEICRGLCTVISENPEQGYLNVFLSVPPLSAQRQRRGAAGIPQDHRGGLYHPGHRHRHGGGYHGDPGGPGAVPRPLPGRHAHRGR